MSDFSDWAENEVCKLVSGMNITLPANLDVALLESVDDASFVEVSYSGYSRQQAPRNLTTWSGTQGAGSTSPSSGSSRSISNNVEFDFGTAGAATTVTAIGLFAENNLFCYALMDTPMTLNQGDSVVIADGIVSLALSNVAGLSNFAANKLLDFLYRGQQFEFPSEYRIGLYVQLPDEYGEGGVECSGNGYDRAAISQWTEPAAGVMKNASIVQFPAPMGAWGTAQGSALLDSLNNLYFVYQFADPKTIVSGAGAPYFPEGDLVLRVQ